MKNFYASSHCNLIQIYAAKGAQISTQATSKHKLHVLTKRLKFGALPQWACMMNIAQCLQTMCNIFRPLEGAKKRMKIIANQAVENRLHSCKPHIRLNMKLYIVLIFYLFAIILCILNTIRSTLSVQAIDIHSCK
jgi:hypothetical protein